MSLFRTLTGQSQKSQRSSRSHGAQQASQSYPELSRQHSSSQPPASRSRPELPHNISAVSASDPLAGQLNHLTEHQIDRFRQFKSTLAQAGLYHENLDAELPSHDDQTLLSVFSLHPDEFQISDLSDDFCVRANSISKGRSTNSAIRRNGCKKTKLQNCTRPSMSSSTSGRVGWYKLLSFKLCMAPFKSSSLLY